MCPYLDQFLAASTSMSMISFCTSVSTYTELIHDYILLPRGTASGEHQMEGCSLTVGKLDS